jgi:hypothetical protein
MAIESRPETLKFFTKPMELRDKRKHSSGNDADKPTMADIMPFDIRNFTQPIPINIHAYIKT